MRKLILVFAVVSLLVSCSKQVEPINPVASYSIKTNIYPFAPDESKFKPDSKLYFGLISWVGNKPNSSGNATISFVVVKNGEDYPVNLNFKWNKDQSSFITSYSTVEHEDGDKVVNEKFEIKYE